MPKIKVDEDEYERLLQIEVTLRKLFKRAAAEDLYVGAGYDPRLDDDEQEGPLVKKLRKLLR